MACRAASRLSTVAWIRYVCASSPRRSSRGAEAVTCSGAKTFPRRRPRIIASAMLPAPTNPMVLSFMTVIASSALRAPSSATREKEACGPKVGCGSRRRPVALLVLLPRTARARIVAADLGLFALDRQRLRAGGAGEVHRLLLRLRRRHGA